MFSYIFFDGEIKEKTAQAYTFWSMHPLFHYQPLCCIQATVHKLAINRNPVVQQSEAYSTFKAFKFENKNKNKTKNPQTQTPNQYK